jgi:hypothetical protein
MERQEALIEEEGVQEVDAVEEGLDCVYLL